MSGDEYGDLTADAEFLALHECPGCGHMPGEHGIGCRFTPDPFDDESTPRHAGHARLLTEAEIREIEAERGRL